MEISTIIATGVGVLFLSLALAGRGNSNSKINEKVRASNDDIIKKLIAGFSDEEQRIIWKYIMMLRDGDEFSKSDIDSWNSFEKSIESKILANSEMEWFMTQLSTDLLLLGMYHYDPNISLDILAQFSNSDKKIAKNNINLGANEVCYLTGRINYLEEKTMARKINYGGATMRSGPFRIGTITYTSTPIKEMSLVDFGDYYVTNKRILFIGKKEKAIRQIKLSDIVSYEIFKDSILFHTTNNKKPMFLQMESDFTKKNSIGETNFDFRYDFILIGFLLRKLLKD